MIKQLQLNLLNSEAEISQLILKKINSKKPFFLGRIGGSDFEIISKIFLKNDLKDNINFNYQSYNILKEYNGYFDKKENYLNLQDFYDKMIDSYKNMDICSFGNLKLINQIEENEFDESNGFFINELIKEKQMFNYSHFEKVDLILDFLSKLEKGSRVLIVSPFMESIEFQKRKLHLLFPDYDLTNIEIITLNTQITYNSSFEDLNHITSENFLQECKIIENQLEKLDFDLALLSCGSYAMPVGSFIKSKLKKRSIYIGGILNVLFGIYGERFDTSFYRKKVNQKYIIEPLENSQILTILGGKKQYDEGLRAYFGYRKSFFKKIIFRINKFFIKNLKRGLRYIFKKIEAKIKFRDIGSEYKF